MSPTAGKYVVLERKEDGGWHVLAEVSRRPGLPARRARRQAVHDALGRSPRDDEMFAVLPRSEWQLSLDS